MVDELKRGMKVSKLNKSLNNLIWLALQFYQSVLFLNSDYIDIVDLKIDKDKDVISMVKSVHRFSARLINIKIKLRI